MDNRDPSPGIHAGTTWPLVAIPLVYVLMGSGFIVIEDLLTRAAVSPGQHTLFRWSSWAVLVLLSGFLSWTALRRARQAAQREAAALSQSLERYRLIAENATDVIWTGDLEGRLTYVSPSVERLRGYTPEEVIGMPFAEVISPSCHDLVRGHMVHLRAQARGEEPEAPVTAEIEQPCKDGSSVWIEVVVRVMRDGEGRPIGVLGVSRDATKRRLAEAALRHSEERFRTVFDIAPVGIAVVDPCGRITAGNPAYIRLTGYPIEVLRRLPDCFALLHPDERDAARAHFAAVAEGEPNRTATSEWRIMRADGSTAWVRHLGAGVHAADGQFAYGMAIVADVTQSRLIEERLRQSQKMEAVGQLAGGVAHDFNNLLQVILGCTGEALASLPEQDPRRLPLGQVVQAARHAAGLTRQLLAFSRRQVLRPEPLDLRAVIRDVMVMLGRLVEARISLVFQPGSDACQVLADRVQMEQVVLNLCLNARDALPADGQVTVTTEVVELDAEYCRDHGCAGRGRYAAIRVVDTGVGMDEGTLARVFEPFFTTKELGKGTGLGLSVVFGIVSQHGGTVTAASKPGQGSTFTVFIPCASETPTGASAVSPAVATPSKGHETILIAEDEELLRNLAQRVLQRAGYTVHTAASGDDAVQVAEQHRGSIGLLLLDVVMPGRSGLQAYEDICAMQGALPCVFVSGGVDHPCGLPLASCPEVAVLPKPYDCDELLRAVRQALDARLQPRTNEAGSRLAGTPTAWRHKQTS